MEKEKGKYEVVLIYSMKDGEEKVSEQVGKFKELIESQASLSAMDEWGKRRLAYPIEDETEGYYVLYQFESDSEFPAELDRVIKISEGVLRSLIIRREKA